MQEPDKIDLDEILRILKNVADKYPESSKEFKAIEIAANALVIAHSEHMKSKFYAFLDESACDLTERQKKNLRDMDID